jgi:hypothetical protein
MADKFECDQCKRLGPITNKVGLVLVQRISWHNGVQFPPVKLHESAICENCLNKLVSVITKALNPG